MKHFDIYTKVSCKDRQTLILNVSILGRHIWCFYIIVHMVPHMIHIKPMVIKTYN